MQLDIVTPKGRLLSEEVEEVTAPGVLGEFGVLPGHIPFFTALKPGVLRYRTKSGGGTFAVGPGFAEVSSGDRVVILTDAGLKAAAIDVALATKERDEAQAKLDAWDSDDAGLRATIEALKAWAEARIAAVGEVAVTH